MGMIITMILAYSVYFVFGLFSSLADSVKAEEIKRKKDEIDDAETKKFNAENEGVNFLYRR